MLLLLHGAIGSSGQLKPLANKLTEKYIVHTLDFRGHGGNEIPQEDFSISLFANDVLKWMQQNSITQTDIFGYSMGGYVALYLARHHPEKIGRIITLATKFNWTPDGAKQEATMLDPVKISEKLPAFADTLSKRHAPSDWKVVLTKTAKMMVDMGETNVLTDEDFKLIHHPVTVSVGELDKMVTIDETTHISRLLKNGTLKILTGTKHPLEAVNIDDLTGIIGDNWL